MTELIKPCAEHLPEYVAALKKGWSADNTRGKEAADEELVRIAEDAETYLALQDDEEARGGPIKLPDGSTWPRLPSIKRWIQDGDFCGAIGFRWQRGTDALPPHVLGHIGFAVVPWKQRQGHASEALRLMLPEAKARGLAHVELTTDPDNFGSQKVMDANGARLVGRFQKPEMYGGHEGLLYRIAL